MELSLFINSLLTDGLVQVKPELQVHSREDLITVEELLIVFRDQDAIAMAGQAPVFNKEAALWAAVYFYQAVQLTVNREAKAEDIKKYLIPFEGEITSSAIYSADLVLRNLPLLLELAKGLAPADPLVEQLKQTASAWPFSSVGMELSERKNEEIIFSDPSLRQEYIDRIIFIKDKKRAATRSIYPMILETTGGYTNDFWPEFETLTREP